jgi:alkanesulfonate monooxygenase SsuD/methylene tetrahydromethanopterin reductase-like flavin-dependent oxidoreductase (luciferase family)
MRLSINLSYRAYDGSPLDAAGITERARWIEDAGFDGIFLPDTLVPESQPRPDPLTWLTVAAAATSRVELGTSILILPTRNATELAQRFMTLALISHNRFSIGVGPGSTKAAHDAAGVPFDTRFKVLNDNMALIRALMRGETVGDAVLRPWPETGGGPRFMLGAWHSETSLKRAVALYDGWMCSAGRTSLATMRDAITRYRELGGTRAMVATTGIDLTAPTTPLDDDGPFHMLCDAKEAARRLEMLAELGFDDVLLTKRDHTGKAARYEADFTKDEVEEFRSLVPRHDG